MLGCLSSNPSAIHLLKENIDKIDWWNLSSNPSAIHLIEANLDKIDWGELSSNPSAIHLLEQNLDKINWEYFSKNPAIFELDYDFFSNRMNIIREELMEKAWHPSRFEKWCI